MLGRVLGNRYEILEKVGEGGMARVYKGIDHRLNRYVAIKTLYEQFVHDPEFLRRFKQEAKASAILSHPAIVNVYDEGEEEGIHFIVMEFVQGMTLKSYILQNSRPKPEEAVRIVLQICDALIHAHSENVIHRDIKPQNIIITPDGRVKVTDFGIARAAVDATITHGRSLMGSVHYSSPEQARGSFADQQSDIYSLGVVLYELLTGNVPFSGESPISIALKHLQEDIVPPGTLVPDLPQELDSIVIKALHKERSLRYASALELHDELEMWLSAHGRMDYPGRKSRYSYGSREQGVKTDHNSYYNNVVDYDEDEYGEQDDEMAGGAKRRRRLRRLIFYSIVLIGFVAIFWFAFSILRDLLEVPEVVVPYMRGDTLEEAQRKLEDVGLGYSIKGEVHDDELAAGLVVSQDPPADRVVRKERVVELTVSLGQALAEVPLLLGRSELEARLMLEERGLEMETSSEFHEEIASGYVIQQDPEENHRLARGETVHIILSSGRKSIALRSFLGWQLADAQEWLEANELILRNLEHEYSDDYPEGQIISQYPLSQEMVQPGTPVDLVLSMGREPTQAPKKAYQIQVNPQAPVGTVIRVFVEDDESSRIIFEGMYPGGPINFEVYGSGHVLLMERRENNEFYIVERKYFP